MKNPVSKSACFSWIILLVIITESCQKEKVNDESTEQIKAKTELTANDNSQIIGATQEVMDITAGMLAGQGVTNGRVSSYGEVRGPELDCSPTISIFFNIIRNNPDSIIYKGTLAIDYGEGLACKDSAEIRKGKIVDSFVFIQALKDSLYTMTEIVTFQNFQKDSLRFDGAFVSKSSSRFVSTLSIENAKITYLNGAFITWSGMFTYTFNRGRDIGEKDNAAEVFGSIEGVNRSGVNFSAITTKPILFKYSCSRNKPVSGTIELTSDGVDSSIDYGAGTCDNNYTITIDGRTTEYTFKGRNHV